MERHHRTGKVRSGIKTFWNIQNSSPIISSINTALKNFKKIKAAKSILHFSALYAKIPHDKLLYVLNEITDFTFKGGTRERWNQFG